MDIYLELTYHLNKGPPFIKTNLKKEKIDDFLDNYLRYQLNQGEDNRKAISRDVYHIRIECDLSDDSFHVTSDTGNKGLTTGIILASRGRWKLDDLSK